MLDIKFIRENPEIVKENIRKKFKDHKLPLVDEVIELGKTLALALEFKMGAEIIKTVIVHDLKELAVLGIVIAIRALLAFLIHWEMKMEKAEEEDHKEH